MTPRNAQIIALGRRIPRQEGSTMRTLEQIGKQFSITGRSVDRILRTHTKQTGVKFGFRRETRAVKNSPILPVGTCLLCKKLTDHPVPGYDKVKCWACGGTGWYVDEIMNSQNKGGV